MYIDSQCVLYGKALIDSGKSNSKRIGTLSTKCNSVVVVPHITQSYADGPEDNNDESAIPM